MSEVPFPQQSRTFFGGALTVATNQILSSSLRLLGIYRSNFLHDPIAFKIKSLIRFQTPYAQQACFLISFYQ